MGAGALVFLCFAMGLVAQGSALQCYICQGIKAAADGPGQPQWEVVNDETFRSDYSCFGMGEDFLMSPSGSTYCPDKEGMVTMCYLSQSEYVTSLYGEPMRMKYFGRNCTYERKEEYNEWKMAGKGECIDLSEYPQYIPKGARDYSGWSCSCQDDWCNVGEMKPMPGSAGHVTISMVTSLMAAIMAAIMW